jgi:CheY-like chemotaxis protein
MDKVGKESQKQEMKFDQISVAKPVVSSTPLRDGSHVSEHEKPTVLIVDDDIEVRHVLRLLCEAEDFEVIGEASNGVEAVPIALKRQPNFVILDYKLPRLDGEGAAEIMRAISPGSKIVAFSAVLEKQPEWADAYLNKERISDLMPLLQTFIR